MIAIVWILKLCSSSALLLIFLSFTFGLPALELELLVIEHMYILYTIYCVTVFIFKLWFTVKILCIQTFYRVESDWVNNNLEIGIQVIIFSSLVCEEYPSFTSQGGVFLWLTDWYVISFLKSQQKSEQISSYKQHK